MSLTGLSIRKLPCLSKGGARTQDFRTRIDPTLVRFVHESVQRKCPHMRVGKRFSLEWVLLRYLHEEGLIQDAPVVPGILPEDPVSICRMASRKQKEASHGNDG